MKRFLSLVLVLTLVSSMVPAALAEQDTDVTEEVTSVESVETQVDTEPFAQEVVQAQPTINTEDDSIPATTEAGSSVSTDGARNTSSVANEAENEPKTEETNELVSTVVTEAEHEQLPEETEKPAIGLEDETEEKIAEFVAVEETKDDSTVVEDATETEQTAVIIEDTDRDSFALGQVRNLIVEQENREYLVFQWDAVSNADGYLVEYTDQSDYSNITSRRTETTRIKVYGLESNKIYYIRVCAYSTVDDVEVCGAYDTLKHRTISYGENVEQAEEPSTTQVEPVLEDSESELETSDIVIQGDLIERLSGPSLYYPTNFKVSSYTYNSVSLSWDPVTNADGYRVQYSTDSGFTNITTLTETGTSITISGLNCGTVYYYRVCAYSVAGGQTRYGDYATLEYRTSPQPPAWLNATTESATSIKLTWATVSEANGYYVYRDGTQIARITAKLTYTMTDNGLVAGTEYTYKIYSFRIEQGTEVISADYAEAKCKLAIPSPKNVEAVAGGTNSIVLTWDTVEGAAYYVVRRNSGTGFVQIGETHTNSYIDISSDANIIIFGKEYDYNVTAYASNGEHSEPSITVTGMATFPAPMNVKAAYQDATSIKVTWDAVSNADGYCVEASDTKNGTYTTVYEDTDNYFTETGLTVGTGRYYRVKAFVTAGSKVYGNVSTAVFDATRPENPKNLKLTNASVDSVLVEWDASPGATGYFIYRRLSNGVYGQPYKDLSGVTSFTDTDLTTGATYYYYVKAYVTIAGTKYPDAGCPAKGIRVKCVAPTAVTVTPQPDTDSFKIEWTPVSGVSGYRVYYQKEGGSSVKIADVKSGVTSFVLNDVDRDYYYVFIVCGYTTLNGSTQVGEEYWCPEPGDSVPMIAPKNLTGDTIDPTSFVLNWTDEKGVQGYKVNVTCVDDPDYKLEQKVSGNSITLDGLTTGYEYECFVAPYTTINNVEYTGPSSYYVGSPTTTSPKNISIRTAYGAFGTHLEWSKVTGCTGYVIERSTSQNGPYTQVAKLANDTITGYGDDMTVNEVGNTYYYRIASYVDNMGQVKRSTWSSVVHCTVLPKKTSGKALNVGGGTIEASWNKVEGVDGYYVYRSTNSNGSNPWIKKLSGDSTLTFTNTGLSVGTRYYFQFAAYKVVSGVEYIAPLSSTCSAVPGPVGVTGLTATPFAKSVELKWNKVTGAARYRIYRAAESGGFTAVGETTALKYIDTGLTCTSTYRYRVVSLTNNGAEGNSSSIITTTTYVRKVGGFQASKGTNASVKLIWNRVGGSEGYQVQISENAGGPFEDKVTVMGETTLNTSVAGLPMGKYYYFRVRAFCKQGENTVYGAWSTITSAFSAPNAVTDLHLTARGKESLTVAWTPAVGATGYKVFIRKTSDSSYTLAATISGGSITEYRIGGLSSNSVYYVKVRSVVTASDNTLVEGWTTNSIRAVTTK